MNSTRGSQTDGRRRRDLLSAAGVATVTGLAGCLGVLDDERDAAESTTENASTDATAELRDALTDADPYRMHQYGPTHVGRTARAGPVDDVDAVWTFHEGADDPSYNIGPPAVVDGTVYVAEGHSVGDDGTETVVYALNGSTGNIEWERSYSGTNVAGPVAVVGGTAVLSIGGTVVAIATDSGDDRWRVGHDFADRITVADGTVYAIETTYADPPTLVALALETGRERWTAPLADDGGFWPTPPAVGGGTVYQGGTELVALSAADGERQWTRDLEADITGSPTVVDGAVYAPVGDGTVAAFDRDGTLRWREPIEHGGQGSGSDPVSSPAVAGGSLYVTNGWQLTAFDAETGSERWTTPTEEPDPPVVADGTVYVSGLDTVSAYDGADGSHLWRHRSSATSGTGIGIAPVVGGTVFFASAGLHALRETDTTT
ncbi:PQQ-binding-like beta-propeller repeat protein [Natrinema sp. CGMCC1.2065]|uniref:outer membrane protein assembly factor BamB family protein n=1 Tax=Natrinema sp. CGMCC1.2065 TaxID=3445767 RepID=UPI003F4A8171